MPPRPRTSYDGTGLDLRDAAKPPPPWTGPPVIPRVGVSDGALIAASIDDPTQFAVIFDRHWPAIHRFCVSRAGAAGEDLAAEVFRVALVERRRFDAGYDDARPWLYGIATNLLRNHLRERTRNAAALARTELSRSLDIANDPVARMEAAQLGPELGGALAGIAAADCEALLLYAWADLTYEQIAVATAVPVGTVRSRIHRARTHVRAHLAITPEAHR